MTRSAQFSFGVAVLATLLQTGVLNAQEPGKTGGLQIAQVSGTMQAMALDKIKIVAEDKKEYFAVVSEQTSLHYKGTAQPDFVTPGLLVRFSADLNQNGQAQGPLTELEIFTVSQHRRMSQEQMRDQTPGVYQVGGDVANTKKPEEKPKAKTSSKTTAASSKGTAQPYRVVGQVAGMKAGKMIVQAGTAQVQFELDPKAVIKVVSQDTSFCQVGDQIKVSGLRNAGQEQFIQAESLEIVGTKPLAPVEGKTAKNSKSTKGSKGKNSKEGSDKDKADAGDDPKADAKKPDTKKTTPKK